MEGIRHTRWQAAFLGLFLLACGFAWGAATDVRAQEGAKAAGPEGGAPLGRTSSRLTISGHYVLDAYSQKNFFLGAAGDRTRPRPSDQDNFATQELALQPRFILADNLNLNVSFRLAQGIWGWNLDATDSTTARTTDRAYRAGKDFLFCIDWAFLSYRNQRSGTRWYLGRQQFALGNLLVLDEDASGLQMYKDFARLRSSLGLGYAKQAESSVILRGGDPLRGSTTAARRGDADLYFAEWITKSKGGGLLFNPFLILYNDRSTDGREGSAGSGSTYLPDGQGYLDARFRPQVSSATVIGLSSTLRKSLFELKFEYDLLKGKDRIKNAGFGFYEVHDINDGTLKGYNLLGQLMATRPAFDLGGVIGQGSGDDNVRVGPGNINYLRNQGHFSLTEVWGNGLALDERGLAPQGLANPYSRGYRGLENTRIFQGRAALRPWSRLQLALSYSMIKAARELRAFYPDPASGLVGPYTTYGFSEPGGKKELGDTSLGKEIDFRLDWSVEEVAKLTLRGGIFKPGVAAGYLINGTKKYQKSVSQIRLEVTVPIREFSLGG